MTMFTYKAVQIHQTPSGDILILFGAQVSEIEQWAGIPQKKEIGSQETTGFQRELNEKRIRELRQFYSDPKNIIQNPLLCSRRLSDRSKVNFIIEEGTLGGIGTLTIELEPLAQMKLIELLKRVKQELEHRLPDLVGRVPKDALIKELKLKLKEEKVHGAEIAEIIEIENGENIEEGAEDVLFSEETHVYDFWEEIAARIKILEELGDARDFEVFLDFSKDAMISFLKPIVLVDGQHRLKGAVEALKAELDKDEYRTKIERAISDGKPPEEVQSEIEREVSRVLPISLLLTSDPAEHVFQFIVVNQKATPIGRALLGTIVSTSLTNDELSSVSDRLIRAGIKLDVSRAAATLTRDPESPFYKLVERGFKSDVDLISWSVFFYIMLISGGEITLIILQ
jgi:hypothetical protein